MSSNQWVLVAVAAVVVVVLIVAALIRRNRRRAELADLFGGDGDRLGTDTGRGPLGDGRPADLPLDEMDDDPVRR